MKNFVRAFALSLVVTGAFAVTHASQASVASQVKVSSYPTPWCDPTTTACTFNN